jgi:hypothetical protein
LRALETRTGGCGYDGLPTAQNRIDRVAAPNVGSRASEMPQNLGAHIAAFFEGVREDGEAGLIQGAISPGTFLVGRPGEFHDAAVVPGQHSWTDRHWDTERISEEATE